MNINKNKKAEAHIYKVVHTLDSMAIDSIYPTVNMEIDEQASLSDHLYAFERFLQSIGFTLPQNSHLDFIENEFEDEREEDIIKDPSNYKNNGTN